MLCISKTILVQRKGANMWNKEIVQKMCPLYFFVRESMSDMIIMDIFQVSN